MLMCISLWNISLTVAVQPGRVTRYTPKSTAKSYHCSNRLRLTCRFNEFSLNFTLLQGEFVRTGQAWPVREALIYSVLSLMKLLAILLSHHTTVASGWLSRA
ncbi:MAG: hypothetical protein Q7U37_03030 [Gallionella sp.]|nr:hypothetical protein [Gallionella sp.]